MGLGINLEKNKALVCTLGYIWGKWSEAAYKRRDTGEGSTFKERKWASLSCTISGLTVEKLSLRGHMIRQHGKSAPQTKEVEIRGEGGTNYLCCFLPPGAQDGE